MGRAEAVGVDGWRKGWVSAVAVEGRIVWQAHPHFASVIEAHPGATVAVDIPIGTAAEPRAADRAARAFLADHGARTSSVFEAPSRHAVREKRAGRTHAEAMASRPAGTAGTSIQAWQLIDKMIEVADVDPGAASVVEAHPECSFRALDPRVAGHGKKTGIGVGVRLRALQSVFDLDLAAAPSDVPVDDLLDAAVLVWTARRYRAGTATILGPSEGPRIVV